MNLSLFTGLPFLPFVTGVSVHISFCSFKPSAADPRQTTNSVSHPASPHVLTTFSKTLPKSQHTASNHSRPSQTHILQCRSKAFTLASLPNPLRQQNLSLNFHPLLHPNLHPLPLSHRSNSQLPIRPNANQHLRMTPHRRLQNRQRAIAHLPVFLFAARQFCSVPSDSICSEEKHTS